MEIFLTEAPNPELIRITGFRQTLIRFSYSFDIDTLNG